MSWRDNDVSAVTLIFNLDQPNNHILHAIKTKIHKKNTINGHLFKKQNTKKTGLPSNWGNF